MADTNPQDLYDSHPESSGYSNDEFEKIDPPGTGFDQDNDVDEDVDDQNGVGSSGTWLKGVDPRVKDLIYWRDVKKTGIVFGTLLMILVSLAVFSLLSVIAYLSLAVLTVTFSFVVYKKIMGAVQKSTEGHPFKTILELDIELSEQKLKSVIQSILKNVNCLTNELRRLFLIEDIVDSIKFGLLLWALTYIGSWFSGMFLIVLGLVLLFTLPKVYETYKVQIDNYFGLAKAQVNNVLNIIQSKVPFLKKKEKAQ